MAKKKKECPPHGVVCYWLYEKPTKEQQQIRLWKLVESYGIDSDGHCLTTPSTGGCDQYEYQKWMTETVFLVKDDKWYTAAELKLAGLKDDSVYKDLKPIVGRAVTLWTMEKGVMLLDIQLEWCEWQSDSFYEKICKYNWRELIQCGDDIYLGTAREAEKYLDPDRYNERMLFKS